MTLPLSLPSGFGGDDAPSSRSSPSFSGGAGSGPGSFGRRISYDPFRARIDRLMRARPDDLDAEDPRFTDAARRYIW